MLGSRPAHTLPANATSRDVAGRIRSIFDDARRQKTTDDQLWNALGQLFARLDSRTPAGRRRYSLELLAWARGYAWALRDQIWRDDLEHCYRDPETGVLYATQSTRRKDSLHRSTEELYQAGRIAEAGGWESAYLWAGTDKPFTPWQQRA